MCPKGIYKKSQILGNNKWKGSRFVVGSLMVQAKKPPPPPAFNRVNYKALESKAGYRTQTKDILSKCNYHFNFISNDNILMKFGTLGKNDRKQFKVRFVLDAKMAGPGYSCNLDVVGQNSVKYAV